MLKKMFTLKIDDYVRINAKRIHLNLYYVFQLSLNSEWNDLRFTDKDIKDMTKPFEDIIILA